MVVKTREKLLDVARQLFARKGVENTTMNDIAEASAKGRRTVYTYFKNKREIFNAIVERESEQLVERLRRVVDDAATTNVEKLRNYLQVRLDLTTRAVDHDGHPLRSLLTGDFRRVDKIRRLALAKEQEIFAAVVNAGVAAGEFDAEQARRLPSMIGLLMSGLDSHRLEDAEGRRQRDEKAAEAIDFIVAAMRAL